MNFARFVELPDQEKLVIVEIQPARELQQENWIQYGATVAYYLIFLDGEITRITIDGEDLTEVFTVQACYNTPTSFYYDPWNQILYVRTPDNDSPKTTFSGDESKYCIVAYFWIGSCNDQRGQRQVISSGWGNILDDGEFELWNSATDLKKWTEYISGNSTVNRDNSDTYDMASTYSVRLDIDCANSDVYIYQDIILKPGGQAKLRIKYKTGLALPQITIKDSGSNIYLDSNGNWQAVPTNIILPISTTWVEYELKFIVHNDYPNYRLFWGRNNAGGQSIWFDYAELLEYYYATSSFQIDYERRENVLEDGGLELWSSATDLKKWTESIAGTSSVNRDSTETYDAQSAYSCRLDIDGANNRARIAQQIKLRPGGKCKIKIKYKNSIVGKTARFYLYDTGSNVHLNSDGSWGAGGGVIGLSNSIEWTEYELEFVAHKSYSNYTLYLEKGNAPNSSIYFDNIEVIRYYLAIHYMPQLSEESIPSINQAVGDYYNADEKIQFGTLWFTDSAWWYSKKGNYNFHNKDCIIRIGAIGSDYEDLEIIFTGVTKKPRISDQRVELDTKDPREKEFQMIPRDRFDLATYPSLDPRYENTVIPILFGEKTNITPVCIDTVNHVYKISQTVFGGMTYALQALDDVYKDGVALTGGGVDYTADLNNGQFTLTVDPGNSLITCDACGIKCDFEDGTYSDKASNIWHFVLVVLNEILESRLNLASFLDLKSGRTQKIGKYLATETETLEFGKELKRSAVFQSFPLLDGQYEARRYISGTDDATPRFRNEDYHAFQLEEDTDLAIRTIIIKYDQDPTSGEWKYVADDYENTEWKHGEKGTLIIETALIDPVEADSIRQFYTRLLRDPADKLIATINPRLLDKNPTDKGIFSKSIIGDSDEEITILEDEVYRILELTKNISDGTVEMVALKDMQSVGYYFHADVTYIDIAYEDIAHIDGGHADSPHVDIPHEDEPYQDDHTDEPHEDTPHEDIPSHDDYLDHDDVGHIDKHGDIPHTDIPYVDEPYEDHDDETPHEDVPHGNTPYQDAAHTDEPHVDEPHLDTPHSDSYI